MKQYLSMVPNKNLKGECSMSEQIKNAMEALKNLIGATEGVDEVKMESVLRNLVNEVQSTRVHKDRSIIFAESTDIQLIRREIKVAYASKSKMKSNPAAVERYNKQIRDGQARINELYEIARSSDDPVSKLIEFNEAPKTVLQVLIEQEEARYDVMLQAYSKAGRKREANKHKATTPDELAAVIKKYLGDEGLKLYEDRVNNLDQRCITINRLVRLATLGPIADAK